MKIFGKEFSKETFGKIFSKQTFKDLFSKQTAEKIMYHKMFEAQTADRIVWYLTVFFIASFMLFETFSWGKFITIGTTALIIVLSFFANGRKLTWGFGAFQIFCIAFMIYTAITSLWGISITDPLSKAFTLGQILLVMTVLYFHYHVKENVRQMLSAVKWAGYVIVLYSILFYGLNLVIFSEGARLENEFTNVNSIGLIAAIACIIQTEELLNKEFGKSAFLMIPSIVVLSATQSRKALVFMAAGVFALIALKLLEGKSVKKSIVYKKILRNFNFCVILIKNTETG